MRDPVVGMIFVIGLLAFIFAGDPDIHDGVVKYLTGACQ